MGVCKGFFVVDRGIEPHYQRKIRELKSVDFQRFIKSLFSFGFFEVYYFRLFSTPFSTPYENKSYICTRKRNQKIKVSYGKIGKQN